MCMILLCHVFQEYGNELAWWFNVGVQIFLVISGFLYGGKRFEQPLPILKKQFVKITLPYYVFLLFVIGLYLVFTPESLDKYSVLSSLLCVGTLKGQGHFWFLSYILFCYLITPYLYWLKEYCNRFSVKRSLIVYILILFAFQVLSFALPSPFGAANVSCYIIGYFIADILRRDISCKIMNSCMAVIVVAALVMNCMQVMVDYCGVALHEKLVLRVFPVFKGYAHAALGIALFLVVHRFVSRVPYNNLLAFSDRYSYEIFITHALFVRSPLNTMYVSEFLILNVVISLVGTVLLAMGLKFVTEAIRTKFVWLS